MIKSYKYLLALLLPALASCESDDVQYIIENPEDQMLISVSAEEVELDANNPDGEALTFTWNAPSDRGEGSVVKSYFRMDVADNNFETSTDLIAIADDQTSISFTNDELNDYLLGWGVSPETTVKIEAEIVATVENPELYQKPELSKVTFLMKGFHAVSRPLWIVNSAMGTGASDAMNELVLGKQYSWYGKFDTGTGVKFVYNKTTQLPSLNKGEDDNTIVRRTEADEPDDLLAAPGTGYYLVTVSTKEMTCKWEKVPAEYENVWMVGNAVPCGWDINNPVEMERDAENPEIFFWEGHLSVGEMKLPLATGNWGCDTLMPVANGTDWDGDDSVQMVPGGNPDNKWNITREGEYRVELNTYLMKIKFIPLD
jgi:hypothetical protein